MRGTTSGPLCSEAWWRTSASPTPKRSTRRTAARSAAGSRAATSKARTTCSPRSRPVDPAAQCVPPPRALQHPGRRARRRRPRRRARPPDHHLRPHLQAGLQRGVQGRLPASAEPGRRGRGRAAQPWGWGISSSGRSAIASEASDRRPPATASRRTVAARSLAPASPASASHSASHRSPPSRLRRPRSPSRSSGSTAPGRRWTPCTWTPRRCYRVSRAGALLGFAQVRNVKGKEQPITYLVAIDSAGRAQGRGRPGVSGAVRRRGGLRALAQAVPRQDGRRAAPGGEGHPEHLRGHHQLATRSPSACARRWPSSPPGTPRASSGDRRPRGRPGGSAPRALRALGLLDHHRPAGGLHHLAALHPPHHRA